MSTNARTHQKPKSLLCYCARQRKPRSCSTREERLVQHNRRKQKSFKTVVKTTTLHKAPETNTRGKRQRTGLHNTHTPTHQRTPHDDLLKSSQRNKRKTHLIASCPPPPRPKHPQPAGIATASGSVTRRCLGQGSSEARPRHRFDLTIHTHEILCQEGNIVPSTTSTYGSATSSTVKYFVNAWGIENVHPRKPAPDAVPNAYNVRASRPETRAA